MADRWSTKLYARSQLTIFVYTHWRRRDVSGHVEIRQPQILQIRIRQKYELRKILSSIQFMLDKRINEWINEVIFAVGQNSGVKVFLDQDGFVSRLQGKLEFYANVHALICYYFYRNSSLMYGELSNNLSLTTKVKKKKKYIFKKGLSFTQGHCTGCR